MMQAVYFVHAANRNVGLMCYVICDVHVEKFVPRDSNIHVYNESPSTQASWSNYNDKSRSVIAPGIKIVLVSGLI